MQSFHRVLRTGLGVAVVAWGVGQGALAYAQALNLSSQPLFLGFKVAPNIMLSIDDSGSMDFEALTKDYLNDGTLTGTQPDGTSPTGAGSLKNRDNDNNGTAECTPSSSSGSTFQGYGYGVTFSTNSFSATSNCKTADDEEWRFRCYQFNTLYFNPNRTYTPWVGLDAAGNPFTDMDVKNAKDNPYNPSSLKIDLTKNDSRGQTTLTSDRDNDGRADGFRYYIWNDLNNNGRFDNGEQTAYFIRDADAATQQNFANWFSYYRSREFVFKAVYGEIIANATNARLGLATLHNNVNGIKTSVTSSNTPIKDMNPDPTTGNKRALLDALYSIHSSGGTPLRTALKNIGDYLACASGRTLFSTDCPALSLANGGACQQNFVIFATDGFYNGTFAGLPSSNANADGNRNTTFDGGAYADSYSNTLADVAMHYYERDLQTSLPNNVPVTPGVDTANHQHMVTYSVSFGLNGTLAGNPPDPTQAFTWPDPSITTNPAAKIDDLRHAAYNGRGLFLSANDPAGLKSALNTVFQDIADRTSSAASVALNSGSRNANSRVYQARFNSGDWSGQLLSFPINNDGTVGNVEWDTAAALDTQNYDTGRVILTFKPSSKTGIPFRWTSLDSTQQNALHINPSSGVSDTLGQARLNYLRGSRADEAKGNKFRVRLHVLGDLVNSDPFFVGPPPFSDSLGTDYATFRSTYKNRTPMVLVGSNDGYLHVINAVDGKELMAYLPSVLMAQMPTLTYSPYAHKYYVDGSPTVGDVYVDLKHNNQSAWRTVVVGGLRSGGRGYYALDITDPQTFQESNAANLVLWEFSNADDADLNFTFSQPSIVRMANGRWAAVFGNGYNHAGGAPSVATTGRAVLYIVFLDGRASGTWNLGTDYIKIDVGVGNTTNKNGLSSPTPIDVNGDTTVEYIVAGDMQGNLWTFDVSSTDPAQWQVLYKDGLGAPRPLYTAKDAVGTPQPITVRPEVGEHPQGLGGLVVYFGTGKYIETADNTVSTPTQTVYAVWDKLDGVLPALSRSTLVQQSVLPEIITNGKTVRVTTDKKIDWQTQRGFYMDLPTAGERQVSDPVLRGGRLIFTTLIPDPNICSYGGTSFLMELDAGTGARLITPPFDLNGDRKFTAADTVSILVNDQATLVAPSGIASTEGILPTPTILNAGDTEFKYNSGSSGGIFVTTESPSRAARGRQAWRQLF